MIYGYNFCYKNEGNDIDIYKICNNNKNIVNNIDNDFSIINFATMVLIQ